MRVGPAVVALVAASAAAVYAQGAKWAEPYRNGVKAFESGRCAEAIPLIERAVAADPKAEPNKRIEGVFRTDYFPYYYLAICYAEQQVWDKASQNLDKARPTLQRSQQAKFTETESKIKLALNAPKADPRKAAFDAAAAQAEASLSAKQFEQALRQFDGLKSSYASEYASANLGAKRDEAARGLGGQLADEARTLAGNQKYNEAKAKFQQAEQAMPGLRQVADGLADIRRREDEYQQLKTQGLAEINARNYASARDKLEQARQRHAELFAADNLGSRLNDVNAQIARGRGPATPTNANANANTNAGGAAGGGDRNALEVQRLTRSAKDSLSQGRYADAEAAYSSVLRIDPRNQEATDALDKAKQFKQLRDKATEAQRARNTKAAQQALTEARTIDPDRFNRERLAAVLDSLKPPVPVPTTPTTTGATAVVASNRPDPTRAVLQQGLTALLSGRAQDSVMILEPAASKTTGSAPLHAYLGVAYATQALSAAKPEDRDRLQTKAVEQFKIAKSAQADYQLSTRIVSPAIVSIYQSAKP